MPLDYSRIASTVDVSAISKKRVAIVGAGASAGIVTDLTRCGVRRWTVVDFDVVQAVNLSRQAFPASAIGLSKAQAVGTLIRNVNIEAEVTPVTSNFCAMDDQTIDELFGTVNLIIMATDSFAAQAKGSQVALRLGCDALWIGAYHGGLGGEVIFWHRGLNSCFRCLCANRYRAQAAATSAGTKLDPGSDGTTVLDIHYLDAIAGQIAIGLLTRGTPTRYGRLIDQLGDRNFIQVKIDPNFAWNGRDIVRERLQIPVGCDAFFAWNAAALRDPDGGNLPCPDCEAYRGVRFEQTGDQQFKRVSGLSSTSPSR